MNLVMFLLKGTSSDNVSLSSLKRLALCFQPKHDGVSRRGKAPPAASSATTSDLTQVNFPKHTKVRKLFYILMEDLVFQEHQ